MGLTGAKGKVYYIDDQCPSTAWAATGTPVALTDEVTRFTIEDSVQFREYGHDKSGAWQDICAGTRRAGITLDAVVSSGTESGGVLDGVGGEETIYAGRVLYLVLYPYGNTGTCGTAAAAGFAMVQRVSYTFDQETGKPVSYTATLASKGPCTGLDGGGAWGGFECNCT